MRTLLATTICLALALPAMAQDDDDDDDAAMTFGMAGLLSNGNKEDLPPILLSAGMPLADAGLTLKSGTYYEIEIEADGSQELALHGAEFFRAIWIDEIVIEGLEVRPLGLDSVEFDQAGVMEIGFIAIKPGTYTLGVPNGGETQRLEIVIQ